MKETHAKATVICFPPGTKFPRRNYVSGAELSFRGGRKPAERKQVSGAEWEEDMSIRILCDSTCDYTTQQAEELGISLVPLRVVWGAEEYYDGVTMQPEEFFDKLAASELLPTTSQPSPEAFLPHFRAAKEAGDEVICILLSAALSGTCQSALIARDMVEYDGIHIIDSRQASLGAQLLIGHALKMREEGRSAEEIVSVLEEERERVRIYLIVDTLLYLQKGGRLSAAGMTVGSALNLKPVLEVSGGGVHVAGIARSQKGAWEKILRLLEKSGGMDPMSGYNLGFTGKRACLDAFEAFMEERLGTACGRVVSVGSVIGVHVGPGANAVAVVLQKR